MMRFMLMLVHKTVKEAPSFWILAELRNVATWHCQDVNNSSLFLGVPKGLTVGKKDNLGQEKPLELGTTALGKKELESRLRYM